MPTLVQPVAHPPRLAPVQPQLPTLRLSDFTQAGPGSRAAFVEALRDVAHHTGFFYLAEHRVSPLLQADLLRHAQAFFALPGADKHALRMANSPHFRGYTQAGGEITAGAADWREQIDFGDERPLLPGAFEDRAEPWRRLQGPNQWPVALPGLRDVVLAWQAALTGVGFTLMRALALALGQDAEGFDAAFTPDPVQRLKLIRYPGRPGADQGVGPHKDSGFLTLLLQHQRGGLQVRLSSREGGERWLDVPPRPGTLVVNLGEALELLTGGFLQATVHRVVSPPPRAERLSVAFFLAPRLDAELPPIALPPALAARARGVSRDPANPLIAHAGRNLLKGRLRSHTDVAARFYADVLPTA